MKAKKWTPEEIREFRKARGLIQKELAQMLGVTERYVIYLEKGVKTPGMTLRLLLDCLEGQGHEKGKEGGRHQWPRPVFTKEEASGG